jgi:uncharacterized cupin superfamily protein
MANVYSSNLKSSADRRSARLGAQAGSEHLGMSLYELAPGQGMVFRYHLQREELLVTLSGALPSEPWTARSYLRGRLSPSPEASGRSRLREPE